MKTEFEIKKEWTYYVGEYEPYHNYSNVKSKILFGETLKEVAKKAKKLVEADIISKAYNNKLKRGISDNETPLNKKAIKNLIHNYYDPPCEIGKAKTIEYKNRKIILEEECPPENANDYECMNYVDLDKVADKILKLLVKKKKGEAKKLERELKSANKEIKKIEGKK